MASPLKFGVIGAGRMAGQTMLHLMDAHPAATPVAWYEIDPSRPDTAERIGQLTGAGLRRCDSLDELLSLDDVDLILNATGHYAHAETTIAALEAGRHVLCEKPPACDWGECQAMLNAATKAERRLLIHFQHLLRPAARWLNQAICRGELGPIRRVRGLSLWFRGDRYYQRVDWAGRRQWNGHATLDGVMANQSIHFLNQMLALADRRGEERVSPASELRSALFRFRPADVLEMEDTAVIVGRLDNDDRTEFSFAATTCAADSRGKSRLDEYKGLIRPHRIEIEGERGRAVWDGSAMLEIDGQPPQVFDPEEGHWPFYFHLQQVFAGIEQPVTPAAESMNTMRTILDAYAAAGDILERPASAQEGISAVLADCVNRNRLPRELDTPPEWA